MTDSNNRESGPNGFPPNTAVHFPTEEWETGDAAELGFRPDKLEKAKKWLKEAAALQPEHPACRVVVVRYGKIAAEWNRGVERNEQLWMASATKSVFSSILGIVIEEGVIPSADAKIIDSYPEAFDVPNGYGPKPGRCVFEKDKEITFRQLISNTSGYMKPNEEPGKVFHYQTFGMNILTHAIAKLYGLYDPADPEGSPGLKTLVDSRIKEPVHAQWDYYLANFDLPPQAKINIFGYYDGIQSSALDMARLGWLWCNWGRWKKRQIIPEAWLKEATVTAPDIIRHAPENQWMYGYGFWTNDYGKLWPDLPRKSFAASGAGSQHIWVWPEKQLVVAQSPGFWKEQEENNEGLLGHICEALV